KRRIGVEERSPNWTCALANRKIALIHQMRHGMTERAENVGGGDGEKSPQFVHLRVHSAYSLLEGALPLKKILSKAVGDGQPAISISDTNNLFLALEFV